MSKTHVLAVLLVSMVWMGSTKAQEISSAQTLGRGVVVEAVGQGSALEKAGIQPGDVLLGWERLPSPPSNPEGARGGIDSVFDWMWLEIEQVPRGRVKIEGSRGSESMVFEVSPGIWKSTIHASMPESIREKFDQGKRHIESEEFARGIELWLEVADAMENRPFMGSSQQSECPGCWLMVRIGDTWRQAKEWDYAQEVFQRALGSTEDLRTRIIIWKAIGYTYEKASHFDLALEAYHSAQDLRMTSGEQGLALASGLNDLGRVEGNRGRPDKAYNFFRESLEIYQSLAPNSLEEAQSLNSLGIVYMRRGKFSLADEYYRKALAIREALAPGSLEVAASLNNLGIIAYERANWEQAAENHGKALEIRQELAPGSIDEAGSLNNLGILANEQGQLRRATEYHERALSIRQALAPGSIAEATSLTNLGNLASKRGELSVAEQHLEQALKIYQRLAPGSFYIDIVLYNLGNLASDRTDYHRAVAYHEDALELRQKLSPGSLAVAASLVCLGILARKLGDLEGALSLFQQALEIQEKLAPKGPDFAGSLYNLGIIAHRLGHLELARTYYTKASDLLDDLEPHSLDRASSLFSLGKLAVDFDNLDQAAEYFEEAYEIEQDLAPNSKGAAETVFYLALVRRLQGHPRQALTLAVEALDILDRKVGWLGSTRDLEATFRSIHERYYRTTVSISLELQEKVQAFDVFESSRAQSFLGQLTERDLVFADIPPALEAQRIQLASAYDQAQSEWNLALLQNENQEQLEEFQNRLRQLRWDYEDVTEKIIETSPRLGALRYPKPLDFDGARRVLDPGTVMLSYSVDVEETHLFILTRDGDLQVETLPIGEEELGREVRRILGLQGRKSKSAHYTKPIRQAGERLYRQLIEPVESLVAPNDRILIVPDGPLHLLPFALLVRPVLEVGEDGRDFQYLVEWKPIHSVLSATVYGELQKLRRHNTLDETRTQAFVGFGDPWYASHQTTEELEGDRSVDVYVRAAARRGFDFEPLPYSRQEVDKISKLFPPDSTRVFFSKDATEEQVKSVGKTARILHFATHGRFDSQIPLNSYLALTIPEEFQKGKENGLLQAWEIFESVRIDADLVTLSACESGLGEELATEGLIGLTRAFQFAGARTVMSSLWQVNDQATAELMERFYRHLRAGKQKDEALRAAQIELIRGEAGEDFVLPYHWAAFQLLGDFR